MPDRLHRQARAHLRAQLRAHFRTRFAPSFVFNWYSSGALHDSEKDLLEIGLLQRELGDRDTVLTQGREQALELRVTGERQEVACAFVPRDALAPCIRQRTGPE